MELKGEYQIPAARERVWTMLNDADVLRACIPGCESLEPKGEDGFEARVTTRIGPVKATFNGTVTLSNMNPPEGYTISGEGKGGVAGFASGSADVRLTEDDAGTVLTYNADAKVGGKLAQLGSRLIDSTARKLADQFFDKFAEMASAPKGEGAAEPVAAAAGGTTADVAEKQPTTPPADHSTSRPEIASQRREEVESTVSHIAHDVAEVAQHAEEELEKRAASGVLGGPWIWGLIVLAAIVLFYLVAG